MSNIFVQISEMWTHYNHQNAYHANMKYCQADPILILKLIKIIIITHWQLLIPKGAHTKNVNSNLKHKTSIQGETKKENHYLSCVCDYRAHIIFFTFGLKLIVYSKKALVCHNWQKYSRVLWEESSNVLQLRLEGRGKLT